MFIQILQWLFKFFQLPLFLVILTEKLYSVFHLPDNLASSLKNGIVIEKPIEHVSKIRTEIEAIQISPEDGFECSSEPYDFCLARERQLLNSSCTLPFEEIISSENKTCSTFEQGMDTVREILAIRENCQQMCLQVNIRYSQEPERYLLALTKPRVLNKFSFSDFGHHYEIPKDVRLLTNRYDYTAPVALGYFGSILGIFTGISMLSFLILFIDKEYINSSIRKYIFLIVQGGFNMYLVGVFIVLFSKFLQCPSTSTVDFIPTKTDFSISVCSKPYSYEIKSFFHGPTERLSNITFLKNWRNISTMIDSIIINNGSHEVNLNLDDNATDIQFFIVPNDDISIGVCNIIDLTPYGMVKILDLHYSTEIEIYLHRNGQFYYEWPRKENMITGSSYKNVEVEYSGQAIQIYDFTAYVNIELKSTLVHESESFDDCVKAEVKGEFGTEMMSCLFSQSAGNNCHTIINSSSLNSMKIILDETKCKTPKTVLNTQPKFSKAFSSKKIRKDAISKDVDIMIQHSSGDKPKVTLRFSGITKLIQVLYFNFNGFVKYNIKEPVLNLK